MTWAGFWDKKMSIELHPWMSGWVARMYAT